MPDTGGSARQAGITDWLMSEAFARNEFVTWR
jgi:hypothetical protein